MDTRGFLEGVCFNTYNTRSFIVTGYFTFFILKLDLQTSQCDIYFLKFVNFYLKFLSVRAYKVHLTGCKESHFYSLPFGLAEASIYCPPNFLSCSVS